MGEAYRSLLALLANDDAQLPCSMRVPCVDARLVNGSSTKNVFVLISILERRYFANFCKIHRYQATTCACCA